MRFLEGIGHRFGLETGWCRRAVDVELKVLESVFLYLRQEEVDFDRLERVAEWFGG